MAIKALNQFCCGCSLPFGIQFILLIHLLQNMFYIVTVSSNIIFKAATFGYNTSMETQTFNAAFCLVGLCFVASGYLGVWYKLEPHLRLFLYYSMFNFAIDLGYLIMYFTQEDTCALLPDVLASRGSAFACGFTRMITIAFMVLLFIIEVYFIFTVWSYCEDLRIGGAGEGFEDLAKFKGHAKSSHTDGLFGVGDSFDGPFPANYGSIATPGIGGSTPIFGGTVHETDYPPRS